MLKKRMIASILTMAFTFSLFPLGSYNVDAAAELSPESFERDSALSEYKAVNGGSIELSTKHAKAGDNSLKWSWENGSKLQTTSINTQVQDLPKAVINNGGVKIYLYNENAMGGDEGYITVNMGTPEELEANTPSFTYKIYTNFTGWRTAWIRSQANAKNPNYKGGKVPTAIEIIPPSSVPNGTMFIDLFDLVSNVDFNYTADNQVPYINNPSQRSYYKESLKTPVLPEETVINERKKNDFATIEKRLNEYIYGSNIDFENLPDGAQKIRYESLQAKILERIAQFDAFNLYRDERGIVRGPGIFCTGEVDENGTPYLITDNLEKIWMALVHDYKLNGNEVSKQKYFDMLDWADDQGWADGSAMGNAFSILLRMDGYAYSLFLMRDELKAERPEVFERELKKLKWYTRFGQTFGYKNNDATFSDLPSSDNLRAETICSLIYILLNEDTPEKVRYMKGYMDFIKKQFEIQTGYAGAIKPGYTGYHHYGIYTGAYSAEAVFVGSLLRYLLMGTSFELDQESIENIRGYLLNLSAMSNKYDIHSGITGRFPQSSSPLYRFSGSYALNGLSGDDDMKGLFLDLWDYNSEKFNTTIATICENAIYYDATLGQFPLLESARIQFESEGIKPIKPKEGFNFKDYGALAFSRKNN